MSIKKILILAANPKTTNRLRLDEELREIETGLRLSSNRDQFKLYSAWAVRRRDLQRALLQYQPHIVHFTGHGTEEGLILEDKMGLATTVSKKALSDFFELFAGKVECVILSACYSGPQATAISKYINYVIGMKKEINDKATIEFAVGFYDALGAGKPVEEAFKFGCSAVQLEFPDQLDYLVPVLKKKDNNEQVTKKNESVTENREIGKMQTKKNNSNSEGKGPTIIAGTIGNVQTVDGDITYNYDIEKYYE